MTNTTQEVRSLTPGSAKFLRSLYSLCCDESTEEDAIDLAYDYLSVLLAHDNTTECDAILSELDVKKVTPAVIASVLTITSGAKSVLVERHRQITNTRDANSAERLLVGLE